jgi:hypothetical protein
VVPLGWAQAGIDTGGDGANSQGGVVANGVVDAAGQGDGHNITGAHPVGDELPGEGVRRGGELAERDPPGERRPVSVKADAFHDGVTIAVVVHDEVEQVKEGGLVRA